NDVLPPSVENDDDSEGEIDVVKELLSDNSIPFTKDEASDSNYQEDPSVPLPPPEPLDAEIDFKPDAEKEIPVVMNKKDEFDVSNDVNDDYFLFMFVIRIFLPYLIYSEMFISFLSAESEDTIFDPDPHCFNFEFDFVESLLNRDTFIDSSSIFDFSGELAHVNPEITESNFDFKEEIHLRENLLYDNSSLQSQEEHYAGEERIKREHADYISHMEMLFTIKPRPLPTIDIVTKTNDVLPPSVENDDDSEGEIDVVKELLSDNSIPFTEDEASDSNYQEDPSVPLPPPEPPDAEIDFKPDAEKEIPVVMNKKDEFDVSNAKPLL
nr:hypothetical protein [Tanacetum cinerariifolium]